jgi:hypothetical protein
MDAHAAASGSVVEQQFVDRSPGGFDNGLRGEMASWRGKRIMRGEERHAHRT